MYLFNFLSSDNNLIFLLDYYSHIILLYFMYICILIFNKNFICKCTMSNIFMNADVDR